MSESEMPTGTSSSGGPMRSLALVSAVVFLTFSAWIAWQAKRLEIALDSTGVSADLMREQAPDFSLPALDGRSISLADYRGQQQVVVVFWASWCEPCRAEAPALSEFYRNYHKDGRNFELLAISIDTDASKAAAFRTQENLPFPVLLDTAGNAAALYHASAIPSLYVIDSSGKVIFAKAGLQTGIEFLLPALLKLPGATPAFGGQPATSN